ncbi:hypothetical protein MAR_014671, partial [Mya arenaria]
MLSKKCIVIDGEKIPCYSELGRDNSTCRRITVKENVVIPPATEMIVTGKLDGPTMKSMGIVEGNSNFIEKHGTLIAKSVVNFNKGEIPLRKANVGTLYKNSYIANYETVYEPEVKQVLSMHTDESNERYQSHMQPVFNTDSENLSPEEKKMYFSRAEEKYSVSVVRSLECGSAEGKCSAEANEGLTSVCTNVAREVYNDSRNVVFFKTKSGDGNQQDGSTSSVLINQSGRVSSEVRSTSCTSVGCPRGVESCDTNLHEQKKDRALSLLCEWKRVNRKPDWQEVAPQSVELKHYWNQMDSLVLSEDDVLYYDVVHVGEPNIKQIVLPTGMQQQVKRELHDASTAGHFGVKRTLERYKCMICENNYYATFSAFSRHATEVHSGFKHKCNTCAAIQHVRIKTTDVGRLHEKVTLNSRPTIEERFEEYFGKHPLMISPVSSPRVILTDISDDSVPTDDEQILTATPITLPTTSTPSQSKEKTLTKTHYKQPHSPNVEVKENKKSKQNSETKNDRKEANAKKPESYLEQNNHKETQQSKSTKTNESKKETPKCTMQSENLKSKDQNKNDLKRTTKTKEEPKVHANQTNERSSVIIKAKPLKKQEDKQCQTEIIPITKLPIFDENHTCNPLVDEADFNNVITLNVGGTVFQTTLNTLGPVPESPLASLQNRAFFDRDPESFRFVLLPIGQSGTMSTKTRYIEYGGKSKPTCTAESRIVMELPFPDAQL